MAMQRWPIQEALGHLDLSSLCIIFSTIDLDIFTTSKENEPKRYLWRIDKLPAFFIYFENNIKNVYEIRIYYQPALFTLKFVSSFLIRTSSDNVIDHFQSWGITLAIMNNASSALCRYFWQVRVRHVRGYLKLNPNRWGKMWLCFWDRFISSTWR